MKKAQGITEQLKADDTIRRIQSVFLVLNRNETERVFAKGH